MDVNAILGLTVDGLKEKLTELNLATNGLKLVLQDRLLDHYGLSRGENEGPEAEAETEEE